MFSFFTFNIQLTRDTLGATPLHYACARRHTEAARALLVVAAADDADVLTDAFGRSAFLWAVCSGATAVVDTLLERNEQSESKSSTAVVSGGVTASIDIADADGATALHCAAGQGVMHLCQALVQRGWPLEVLLDGKMKESSPLSIMTVDERSMANVLYRRAHCVVWTKRDRRPVVFHRATEQSR